MSLRYLSTKDAAKIIGVHPNTMRCYVEDGEIAYVDIGRHGRPRIRISEDELRAFMDKRAGRSPGTAA